MKSPWWQSALGCFRISGRTRRSCRRTFAASPEPLEYRLLLTTRVWDGGSVTSDQWTNRFNWVGNERPVFGDDLVFPDSIRFTDRGLNNDFPVGTQFDDITFEGEGYLIRGNRILLSGDISYHPKSDVNLSDSKLNLDFEFSAGDHRINLVAGAVERPELEFNGRLTDSGDGTIFISGQGTVIFGGNDANVVNSHDIVVENSSGTQIGSDLKLVLDKPDNVAAIAGPLVVTGDEAAVVVGERGLNTIVRKVGQLKSGVDITLRNGGFLGVARETIDELTMDDGALFILVAEDHDDRNDDVGGVITLTDTVSVTGNDSSFVGSDKGKGRFRLNPGSTTPREFNIAAGASLKIIESLSEGNLRKTGGGALFLRPSRLDNTHGTTSIEEGALVLASGFSPDTSVEGRIFIPHDLFIGNGGRVFHRTHSNVIADSAVVHLSNGAQFFISDGVEETIRELTAEGNSLVEVSDADTELTVTGFAEFEGSSQLTAVDGGSAKFLELFVLDRSTATADEASLQFTDLAMSGGFLRSIGANGRTTLFGKLTVNATANQATINGKLLLRSGNHDFVVGDGDTANDLVINAVIDDGAGVFGNPASITKKAAGRMLLTAANTYHGTTTLVTGALVVNGQHALDQGDFIVNGGTLTGKGLVREVIQNAGVLNPGFGIGILTVTESTFLGDQSKLVVQINGATAGTQFDQLKTGVLALGTAAHAKLDVRLGFTPSVGQQFRIVNVTGNTLLPADQVFRDLQGNVLIEGASFLVDGLSFTITYKGGSGNDVVITRNTPPAFRNIAITPEITEGQSVFVTGHITEPNPGDTFFLDVNWGDGSLPQTFRFAPGSPRDIRVGHRYLDDPVGANDRYHVRLSWRDQFGGNNSAALSTIVRNAAPKIQTLTASLPPLRVGVPITIQGVISDRSPSDSLRVFIQWEANGRWQAMNLPAGSTTLTFHHTYGRIGQHQVTVQVIDDDLDFDQLKIVLDVV